MGEVDRWCKEAAEVGGDVAIDEFGEGAVALEALPDDVLVLVLFDELAGEGGFAGAAGGVDEDEAGVVFDPGLELGEFGGAAMEGEEGWSIEEVFGGWGCSIGFANSLRLLLCWILLRCTWIVSTKVDAADFPTV